MDAEQVQAGHATVVAVFEDADAAERALDTLRGAGMRREEVSLVLRDGPLSAEALDETGANVATGAATGATAGGLAGGLAGWLLASLVPGIGPVLGAGVLASTLAGAAVGAAGGGIVGGLAGLGVPAAEAESYAGAVQAGRVLATVRADDEVTVQRIVAALEGEGATEVRVYGGDALPATGTDTAPTPQAAARDLAAPAADVPTGESGDVVAAESGGPDVRGEMGDSLIASRDPGGFVMPDPPSEWRSGGEAMRPADSRDKPDGADGGSRDLDTPTPETAPAASPYYSSPGLLSRSALGRANQAVASARDLIADAAPPEERYGDADTE